MEQPKLKSSLAIFACSYIILHNKYIHTENVVVTQAVTYWEKNDIIL